MPENLRTLKGRIRTAKNIAQLAKTLEMVSVSKIRRARTLPRRCVRTRSASPRSRATRCGHCPRTETTSVPAGLESAVPHRAGHWPGQGALRAAHGQPGAQARRVRGRPYASHHGRQEDGETRRAARREAPDRIVHDGRPPSPVLPGLRAGARYQRADPRGQGIVPGHPVRPVRFLSSRRCRPSSGSCPWNLRRRRRGGRREELEPGSAALLAALLPHFLEVRLFDAVMQAFSAEHAARMVAMQNAKANANDIARLIHAAVQQNSAGEDHGRDPRSCEQGEKGMTANPAAAFTEGVVLRVQGPVIDVEFRNETRGSARPWRSVCPG